VPIGGGHPIHLELLLNDAPVKTILINGITIYLQCLWQVLIKDNLENPYIASKYQTYVVDELLSAD